MEAAPWWDDGAPGGLREAEEVRQPDGRDARDDREEQSRARDAAAEATCIGDVDTWGGGTPDCIWVADERVCVSVDEATELGLIEANSTSTSMPRVSGSTLMTIHGCLMYTAFGVILPAAAYLAKVKLV